MLESQLMKAPLRVSAPLKPHPVLFNPLLPFLYSSSFHSFFFSLQLLFTTIYFYYKKSDYIKYKEERE